MQAEVLYSYRMVAHFRSKSLGVASVYVCELLSGQLTKRFHKPHNERRSVAVLDHDDWDTWLTAKAEPDVRSFLRLFDPETMTASPDPRSPSRKE
jgi:putative SOS response-associated peptidase YedK